MRDAADVFEPAQRSAIEEQHAFLRADHGIDYRVETVRGVADLDRFAVDRFTELAIGSVGLGGRGLLLVIDPESDQVRLEVGRALEGSYPDAFVAYVEQRQMVPFFRAGRVGEGVLAATELIVAQAQRETANGGLAAATASQGSAGGGARTRARIGEPEDHPAPAGPPVAAGDTPETTLARYLAAMRARNTDPALEIYSEATRAMLSRAVMAPAQIDTLVRTYRECRAEAAKIDAAGQRAVIRYPVAQRACAPWFFVREAQVWRLDFAGAAAVIRFGRDNSWHFAAGASHPYGFAFADWQFDRYGFPRG